MGKRTAYFGVLAALAIIFGYIEAIFPFHIGIQGVKLGIANLVIVIVLYKMGNQAAFAVSIVRIVVSGFLFSNAFSIQYRAASYGCVSDADGQYFLLCTSTVGSRNGCWTGNRNIVR